MERCDRSLNSPDQLLRLQHARILVSQSSFHGGCWRWECPCSFAVGTLQVGGNAKNLLLSALPSCCSTVSLSLKRLAGELQLRRPSNKELDQTAPLGGRFVKNRLPRPPRARISASTGAAGQFQRSADRKVEVG
jgi:hypothetical protein